MDEKGSRAIISKQEKNIQRSKLTAFKREELIDYLLSDEKIEIEPEKMFNLFVRSSSLDEFLASVGMAKKNLVEFMKEYRNVATKDFTNLKAKYDQSLEETQLELNKE